MAQTDFVLELDSIEGESDHVGLEKKIDVTHWGWSISNHGSAGMTQGGGTGKAHLGDMSVGMMMNKASPNVFSQCCSGLPVKSAKLHCFRQGQNKQIEYLMIEMTNATISSYTTGGSNGGGLPNDSFTLNFAKVDFSYWPQKDDSGAQGAVNKKGYDSSTTTST